MRDNNETLDASLFSAPIEHLVGRDAKAETTQRWLTQLRSSIPALDVEDVVAVKENGSAFARQNMPEIAQAAYMNAMR